MPTTTVDPATALYHRDETAWLDEMAALAAAGRADALDLPHLGEYLTDMANRDRREVFSRLVVLLTHLLKWDYQPDHRSNSWRGTVREQRRELRLLLASGALRNHADEVFAEAYVEARAQAADETGLDQAAFPAVSLWAMDDVLADTDL